MTGDTYIYLEGALPLLVSMPHDGEAVPENIATQMTSQGRAIPDTDWDMHRLYAFAPELGAHLIRTHYSRFVIDLNRDPEGKPLYPGASNTSLVPVTTFAEQPIWRDETTPDDEEIQRRREMYWHPYHRKIRDTLDAMVRDHGVAVLFDAHSIRSRVPRFFDGELPTFNLGTGDGVTCDEVLTDRIAEALNTGGGYSLVINGRFQGGYITRHYGNPAQNIHAIQLEMSQAAYADPEWPYQYSDVMAAQVKSRLRDALTAIAGWIRENSDSQRPAGA